MRIEGENSWLKHNILIFIFSQASLSGEKMQNRLVLSQPAREFASIQAEQARPV